MSDTTEGIERALAAWEGAARAATEGRWVTQHGLVVWAELPDGGTELVASELERENAEHIIRNDPAAVLRMVAGIRAVVALHPEFGESGYCATCISVDERGRSDPIDWPCPTLQALAAMFAPAAESGESA